MLLLEIEPGAETEDERADARHVDADDPGRVRLLGHGADRLPRERVGEEQPQPDDRSERDPRGDEPRHGHACHAEVDRRLERPQVERLEVRGPDQRRAALQRREQPEQDQQAAERVLLGLRSRQQPLDQHAGDREQGDGGERGDGDRQPPLDALPDEQRPDDDEDAVREVEDVEDAHRQAQADGDGRVDEAQQQARHDQLGEQREGHQTRSQSRMTSPSRPANSSRGPSPLLRPNSSRWT
jgi:hypothetical protein